MRKPSAKRAAAASDKTTFIMGGLAGKTVVTPVVESGAASGSGLQDQDQLVELTPCPNASSLGEAGSQEEEEFVDVPSDDELIPHMELCTEEEEVPPTPVVT